MALTASHHRSILKIKNKNIKDFYFNLSVVIFVQIFEFYLVTQAL
jgi:hypothetical protein